MSERASQGGFEMVVLGAAGIAVSAGAVVWTGAALSAVTTGGCLSAGLGEAIAALPRLPREWADPRRAWPVEHRAELPGPVLYWLSTFVVAAVVAATVVVVYRFWRASRERGRVRLGVDTRARFATVRDLAPLVVDRPAPRRGSCWVGCTGNSSRRRIEARRRWHEAGLQSGVVIAVRWP